MPHEHEYDPTFQSPSERRNLLSQGVLRLRRLFVQVANVTTLRTDTITERTDAAGVTVDGLNLKDGSLRLSTVADPGDAGAIPVTTSAYCPLVTAGAETRTLAAPTFIGQELTLYMKTDGGDCVVTCSTTVNETGNNTITFANTGEAARIFAVEEGSNLRWRMATADGATLTTV